jgi:PPOX class probable F420-dependent enzyme
VATVDDARRLAGLDNGLANLSTLRTDGSVHGTVVNAGIIDHPVTGEPVAAFVARPGTLKLRHLRETPVATLCWRAGWAWCTIEGGVELVGPDDELPGIEPDAVPGLLRCIYSAAAGGDHPDWAEFDRAMAAERRVAALVRPTRIYVNP